MLARENRLIRAEDFRTTMRSGRKVVGESMVIYLKTDSISAPPRFGFVVSKSVGSAVDRNLIKRRLRSAIRNSLKSFQNGQNLVIRALPGVKFKTWTELETEISESVAQAAKRGHDPDLLIK